MTKLESFGPSPFADKKFKVVLRKVDGRTRTIHFGQSTADDYTKSGSLVKKNRYIQRHKRREDWNDPLTAGFWAKHILWNRPTVQESLAETRREYNL